MLRPHGLHILTHPYSPSIMCQPFRALECECRAHDTIPNTPGSGRLWDWRLGCDLCPIVVTHTIHFKACLIQYMFCSAGPLLGFLVLSHLWHCCHHSRVYWRHAVSQCPLAWKFWTAQFIVQTLNLIWSCHDVKVGHICQHIYERNAIVLHYKGCSGLIESAFVWAGGLSRQHQVTVSTSRRPFTILPISGW